MADIHILAAEVAANNGSGVVRVVYHVPNDGVDNTYPGLAEGMESEIPAAMLGAGEAEDLADGSLYEHIESMPFNKDALNPTELAALIRARWHVVASAAQARLNRNYAYYGTTLARS